MKFFVIIATTGRADCTRRVVNFLERQTRRPDRVIVVGADATDVEGVATCSDLPVDILLWEKGLTKQRNRGLDHIEDREGIVVFFDDDFVPSEDYLSKLADIFDQSTDLVGVTGRAIQDGVNGKGISFDEAVAIIDRHVPEPIAAVHPRQALYGCNMAIRLLSAKDIRFDERLPLYGWQEDIDFTYQLGKRGRLVRDDRLTGVHMGIKAGRSSGKRLGYSQIANPFYLLRKRTIPRKRAYRIMWRNVASNIIRSVKPEAHVDRRGRLFGNLLALRDLVSGHLRPERIFEL